MALINDHLARITDIARGYLTGRRSLEDASTVLAQTLENMLEDGQLAADPIDLEIRSTPNLLSRIPSAGRWDVTDIFKLLRPTLTKEEEKRLANLCDAALEQQRKLRGPTA